MECHEVSRVVYQVIDAEVSVEISAEVVRHLTDCPDCDNVVEVERRVKMLVARACACADCPEGLEERILKALEDLR